MANWLNGLKQMFQGGRGRPRSIRKHPALKPQRLEMVLERLEDRLTPSTLSLAGGDLQYVATSGETNNLTVSYSTATHKYTFADTGALITSTISGETGSGTHTVVVPDTGVTNISIDLSANSHNDVANIDSINAAATVTTGGGMNTINVSSNAPTNTGNLAGIAAALTVTSTNGGFDSLVMSNFSAATGDSNVVVGPSTITGFAPNTITYNTASNGSFSLVRLIGSNSPSLAEKFTVNDPNASTFQLDSNAGGDTAVIEGTNSGSTNNINMGAGAATVTVSSDGTGAGSLTNILGALNINKGSGSGKTLNLIDFGGSGGKSVTVSGTAVTGFTTAPINYKAVGGTFSNITLSGSNTASDTFTVTANSPAVNLAANGGGDAFILKNNATVKSIAGGAGADTLTYGAGYTNPVSVTLAGSTASGFSSASATGISGGFTGIDQLNDTGPSTLIGENGASTWTVSATPSYNDGSNTLDFSGFTTLDGGTGGNTFNVSGGASGYTINGNTGSDTLTGVSNAVLSSSTASGFSGAADNGISFSAIDALDGSGSLTGENAASTWTISATPSYNDGSNTLDFSGFTTLDGGTGGNTFNVSGGASGYTINGNTGTDTLTGVSNAVLSSSTASGFSGTAASSISFSAIDALDGSGSLTGDNNASTWTINAVASNSTYNDGSSNLTFSGFSTLDGGSGDNTFNLGAAASGYSINGSTGTDTLTGVSNAVLASSTASGFSGTADNGISFSAIDALDGSGSLTGDNNASTWTVNAVASNSTYNDGTDNLTFSGFSTLDGGSGDNTFNLGATASGYTINGNTGSDTLTGVSNAVLSSSTASGFSGTADNGISFSAIDALDGSGSLTGESGASTWTVNATPSYNDGSNTLDFSGFTTLDGGSGGNTFNLGATASGYTINGNTGSDTLTGVSNAVLASSTASGFSGTADSSISFSAIDALDGSGSLTGENAASTWTVNATPSYNDGSNTLDFSGFTTLDGGTGGNTFNVSGGASGYTINGNTGTDTLTGVSNAVLSSSTASGFSGTADSSIGFSAIDALDGSGSLTGDNNASTWTINAVAADSTYAESGNSLTFSGFSTLDGGSGGNTFNLGAAASGYSINGSTGSDTLTGVSNAVLASSTASGFSGTADSSIGFSAIDALDGSGSLTGESGANGAWTVGSSTSAASTYADGNGPDSLSFSGFSTLNAGAGDAFNLTTGASPSTGFTINGGAGSDTLNGVSNPTLTGSGNSQGYSGTADNTISFTGIDVLTGSGTFTGDNNNSTFTIGATTDSYNDGATSNSLTFSGFSTVAGGSGNDLFTITTPGSDVVATLGTLDGGGGTNTLDATNVNFAQQIADGYNYTNFQFIVSGGTFVGPNVDSTYEWNGTNWTIDTGSGPVSIGTPTTIDGGSANDAFIVDPGTTTATNLFGGAGDDSFTIGSGASATGAVDGGTGSNTLNVAGNVTLTGSENDGNEVGYAGTNANLGASGFVGIGVLNDDPGDTLTGENTPSSWSVAGSGGAYNDGLGNGSLSFSGFGALQAGSGGDSFTLTADAAVNLDGGSGDDSFTVSTFTLTGGIIGGAGTDTLNVSSDVSLTGSDATGFSGSSANISGGFSGIDNLVDDPGDTLTGENSASTWTVNAVASNSTYNDGSNTLDFSGFSTLDGGTGGNTFNVSGGASGYTINGNTGTDTLTGVSNAVLASSTASGFSGTADNGISFSAIDALDGSGSLTGENSVSTWTVNAVASSSTYNDGTDNLTFSGFSTLDGGTGGNTFNLGAAASGYTINGSTGTDTLTGVSDAVLSSSTASGFSGAADNGISFSAIDALDGSGSLTGENAVSTWTVSATPSYNDGSNTLDFSGFTTLDGGTGGNTFNVSGGASGYTINGNTGTDTLTGVSNAVLSSSTASGFSGTADSSIGFSAIDALDGSGSLTGENSVSTWTVNAVASSSTYNDGTDNLTFSGFSTLDGGTGGNTFNLGAAASGYTINGSTGTDTLTGVSDAVLSSSTASGFSGTADNGISFSAIDVLDGSGSLTGDNNASTWTVNAVAADSTYAESGNSLTFSGFTTLDGGSGGNTFNLGAAAAGYTINGFSNDTLTGVSDAVLSSSASSGFSGTADNSIAFTNIATLEGIGFLTGENTPSTWTVNATPTYNDGSNTLSFSGFSTLQAGETTAGPGDAFNVSLGGYTIDGNAGADTLSFTAAYGDVTATLSGSSANGYNGSESESGTTFEAIDQLFADASNTNSLTGENASTNPTWDLAATQTYNDGSGNDASALVFSNFQTLNGGADGDTFNVTVTTAGGPLTLNGNGGFGDTFNVGFNGTTDPNDVNLTGSLANVQGAFTINGVGAGLNVSDAADTTAVAWTITAADIQSGSAGDIIYNGAGAIDVYLGLPTADARNAVDVESLTSGTSFLLVSQGNSDVQFAQVGQDTSALAGANIFLAGTSTDTLIVNDQADPGDNAYTVSDSNVTTGSISITIFSPFGQEVVFGGSGANTFDVTPSTVASGTTITVDGGSSGNNTLNYHTPSNPPCNPQNDDVFSITDADGNYLPVNYFDFLMENIV